MAQDLGDNASILKYPLCGFNNAEKVISHFKHFIENAKKKKNQNNYDHLINEPEMSIPFENYENVNNY